MAHLQRIALSAWVALFFAVTWSAKAHADHPSYEMWWWAGDGTTFFAGAGEACLHGRAAGGNAWDFHSVQEFEPARAQCYGIFPAGSNNPPAQQTQVNRGQFCYVNGAHQVQGGPTTCSGNGPPAICSANTVRQYECQNGWDNNGDGRSDVYTNNGQGCLGNRSLNGCLVTPTKVDECYAYTSAPTKIYCKMTGTETGQPSAGEPATDTPNSNNPCPPGTSYGLVNGIGSCLASGTPPTTTPNAPATSNQTTTTTANPGGGTTTTTTTTTNNSSTTTNVVKDANGVETGRNTTTTTGDPSLARGSTDQANFCRDNPTSPMCRTSSWAGSCPTTFTCDGDAVQCAQAQAAYLMACDFTKDSPQKTLGVQIASGSDPLADTLPRPDKAETKSISIDSTGFLGGSCLQDVTVSVMGESITLPFSDLCLFLDAIGLIMLACAGLLCARIIGVWG